MAASTVACMETNDDEEEKTGQLAACSIENMLMTLAESNAYFKSQQRGDADLTKDDKYKIAKDILERNPLVFLSRFWSYLSVENLVNFKYLQGDYEADFYIKQIQHVCKGKISYKQQVKNRRYKAVEKLSKEGYFSEDSMMKRDPAAYELMVGQYLSEEEKELQASEKLSNIDSLSSLILSQMENSEMEAKRWLQEQQVDDAMEEEETDSEDESGASDNHESEPDEREKQVLRSEFRHFMEEKFLSGKEAEFDYSAVDDNAEYDDLDVLQRDAEDKYFDEDDEFDVEGLEVCGCDQVVIKTIDSDEKDMLPIAKEKDSHSGNLTYCPDASENQKPSHNLSNGMVDISANCCS